MLSSLFACKGPMAKIEAVRDALVDDDAAAIERATSIGGACADGPLVAVAPNKPGPHDAGCLTEIANALGSKQGFSPNPPDHAAATTAAIVLLREGRGDYLTNVDRWLVDLRSAKGVGHDALRLAVARKMAAASSKVGARIEDEGSARSALQAVASAIPGACPTYWLVGSGASAIPAELSADHAACVQRDLARREGPGGGYGSGTFRALEGALSIWRETERALRMGLGLAEPAAKAVLEKKLAIIEAATRRIETKKVETDDHATAFLSEAHAEAGVILFRRTDAGGDAARPSSP